MSGQGYQFPGYFPNNPALINNTNNHSPGAGNLNAETPGLVVNQFPDAGVAGIGHLGTNIQNPSGNGQGNLLQGMGVSVGSPGMPVGSMGINQPTENSNQSKQENNPPPPPSKEFNTALLCSFGQETVQDIVSRTQDVFKSLKGIQPPKGVIQSTISSNENKARIQEQLRTIRLLFKRLRLIYEKCNEIILVPEIEYGHIESLIPLCEEYDQKSVEDKAITESHKLISKENAELMELVIMKNKHLKEVINKLRTIVWRINTMLAVKEFQ